MGLIYTLKNIAEHIPYSVGRWTSHVPYRLRLGRQYTDYRKAACYYEQAGPTERCAYVVDHLNRIVEYAQRTIPFYQNLYGRTPLVIRTLKDFEQLPIITKPQVREYSKQASGAMVVNTGGSSGAPLSLYLDKNAWAREWGHMHYIWGLRGYKHTSLMITILGKNLGSSVYRYNAVHNEIRINPYVDAGEHVRDIMMIFKTYPVAYIQGYPSSIYNLLRELDCRVTEKEKSLIASRIRGCFLSSEYPVPYMIQYIRDVWCLDYISWYGHSEMSILAYDNNRNGHYVPFITYGYAEDHNGTLCGTSYHNYDMPLIRYSTGDLIESRINDHGLVDYFVVNEGREGDFIEDSFGKMLPLTSVIFGRHHKIFNVADYVQIHQARKGSATLFVTLKEPTTISETELPSYFNISDLNVDFHYAIIRKPVLTIRGKLRLKLATEDIEKLEAERLPYE